MNITEILRIRLNYLREVGEAPKILPVTEREYADLARDLQPQQRFTSPVTGKLTFGPAELVIVK